MSAKIAAGPANLTATRWPKSVIARFVARRTVRSATFVALAFGVFVASKTIGYAQVYPTERERASAAALLVNNIGLKILFGAPHQVDSVAGYAVWYGLTIGVLLGSIWAYLVATKTFRGEETAGRWELLLAGQTSRRRAAANALSGLGMSLALFYVIAATVLVVVGRVHSVDFAAGPALFFALAAVSGAVMFIAVGALASQLMPTRARAAGLAAAVFGVCYLVRAAGDVTSAHWLVNLSPLGWVEQLQPLYAPQPLWLVPIALLTVALCVETVVLAGQRDMGASLVADHDTAKPHILLLNGPLGAAVRLTRAASLSWTGALVVAGLFFGALTNTAVQVFQNSTAAKSYLDRFSGASAQVGAQAFLGIVFFLFMLVLMAYAASAVGAMREDEAQGYLDNLLVRAVGRGRWLWGRMALIVVVAVTAGVLVSLAIWMATSGHPNGLTIGDFLKAGINMLPAALFTLGLGVFVFGVMPRLTTVVAYGVIVWSFLVQLVSSGINLNHWLLDTSVFTHVALAPAAEPKWGAAAALVGLGAVLAIAGAVGFAQRDLANE